MQSQATVYHAELEAIYQEGNFLEENRNQVKPKYVLTDSQSALQVLNNIDFKSTIALKIAEAHILTDTKMYNSLG